MSENPEGLNPTELPFDYDADGQVDYPDPAFDSVDDLDEDVETPDDGEPDAPDDGSEDDEDDDEEA